MIPSVTIDAAPPPHPVLDWAGLVEEGRATLAAMSEGGWTDFNAHDPGITILEVMAYALTDLGYRAHHSIADLTAGAPPLLEPAAALTTHAVTQTDRRRLGLDVPGVRNLWIEPGDSVGLRLQHAPGSGDISFDEGRGEGQPVVLSGVYRVTIEKAPREDRSAGELARAAALRLHAERNLGEDYESFAVLETQPVAVIADLEIADPSRADAVLLDVLARLEAHFSPFPARAMVADLRAAGSSSDTIYDGPMLQLGITAGLADPAGRRRILHLSDIIAVLADVSGVRATRRVRFGLTASEAEADGIAWSLALPADRAPAFDIQASRIRLRARGAVAVDSALRPDLLARFVDSLRAETQPVDAMRDDPPPRGRDRSVARYRPLRFDLPRAYGVRPGSLPRDAAPAQRAAANQLRAYLAIPDALLANAFAQLDGAAQLLAGGVGGGRSYFTQAAEPASGEGSLDEAPVVSSALDADKLQALVEVPGDPAATVRRNRFLEYLLARFGENVPAVPKPVAIGFDGDPADADGLRLLAREAFFKDLSRLSAGRGSGTNLLLDGDESPLVARIRLKLGLPPTATKRLLLVEHILLRGHTDDLANALPLLSLAHRADPYSLQLSFIIDSRLGAASGDKEAIERVIREECPAHLIAYVRWLDPAAFDLFDEGHARWLAALRRHRRESLEFPLS